LLICTASGSKAHLGKVAYIDRKFDFAFGGFMGLIIPDESQLFPRYFYYALTSENYRQFIQRLTDGANINNLKFTQLSDFPIPIPPLAEQKRIVAKIDAAFEKIDKLKANAEKNLANAKELFQSALDEAMRPKEHWVEKRLGEVCRTTSGGTPIKSRGEYYEGGDIPWLRSGEVCRKDIIKSEMFITKLGLKNSSAKIMPMNTVLIAMYGATAAQAGILRFEAATNQAICGILPNQHFEPEFLYYYFRKIQHQLAARAQGGAQPNISQEKIKDTFVPIVPLSEQREIVNRLDLLAEKIKILEQNYTQQIADCAEMRQSVLREAFEGRL
jgi:type I restriction enzyme S subunit